MKLIIIMLCLTVGIVVQSAADEKKEAGLSAYLSGLFALGAKVQSPLYIDSTTNITAAPYIFGTIAGVSIEGNRADVTVWGNGSVYAALTAQYRTLLQRQGTALQNEALATVEMGATLGVRLAKGFVLRGTLYQDLLQRHNGQEFDVQLFRHDRLGEWFFVTMVAMQWQSHALSQYYFATPDYSPKQSYSAEFEMIATYYVKQIGMFVGTRNFWYANDVANSPIVNNSYILQGFGGVGYRF